LILAAAVDMFHGRQMFMTEWLQHLAVSRQSSLQANTTLQDQPLGLNLGADQTIMMCVAYN